MLNARITFDPGDPAPALAALPEEPGIFALFGADEKAEPYLARTTNLRHRLKRFLDAKPTQSKRLRLTERVVRIEYTATGSEFESALTLYAATLAAFGDRARRRLRLRAPYFLRMTRNNRYPRVYATNSIARSAANFLFGPFPSRNAAERFCDEMLNLFLLRRCYPDLDPDPQFPGCVYSEMKMCLAPCFQGCSDERYAEEAAKVEAFLATRGVSLLAALAEERDAASAALDFEKALAAHARLQKVEAVAGLASEAVGRLGQLRAIVIQPARKEEGEAGQVALYLLSGGLLAGPVSYSTLGMRLHNEQSGSSSLYTHPFALEAIPMLGGSAGTSTPAPPAARDALEERLALATMGLDGLRSAMKADAQTPADHLALFARWYYRPTAQRVGEAVFADAQGRLPVKAILRAISRVFRGRLAVEAVPEQRASGRSQSGGALG